MAWRVTLALALALELVVPVRWVSAQQHRPGTVSATATLSILTGVVQHVPAGATQPRVATDGMNLGVGDRLLTGRNGRALVTFLDGSTLTVEPGSEVVVRVAVVGGGKARDIGIRIIRGTSWARVARLVDPRASFSLESNTAVATVHDGLIGARQDPDGSFACWTWAGELVVKDARGRPMLTLKPGEFTAVKAGQATAPWPFFVHQSTLKVTATAGVLPLVQMADMARVAGFVVPGVEVNQVYGSFTGIAADGARTVEVPAGVQGPFILVLEGQRDGPFRVNLAGLFQGSRVYQFELSGMIKRGQRLSTGIVQQMDRERSDDPRASRVQGASLGPLRPMSGPLPGKILLSPAELETAGGG